ncbi:uncharacterized protein LOC105876669 [Microcebus murinus]|uniref:uncharacterized protein LOC105876669 n=1 Tax=Microcebus murinus TaxID=30608 RepID=UPI003F6C0F01
MAPSALSPRLPRPRRGCAPGKAVLGGWTSPLPQRRRKNPGQGAGERRARKSPSRGRAPDQPAAAARRWGARPGPAAVRGGSGSPGGAPGGQCRRLLRGDGWSFSPRQPETVGRRWWRAVEAAANCASGRGARGMSPRGTCAHRRGPSRSLPQPPLGEGFLLAARSPALPAPASMPSARPAAPRPNRRSRFSEGPAGGGAGAGLPSRLRVREWRESRNWMGREENISKDGETEIQAIGCPLKEISEGRAEESENTGGKSE